VKQRPSAAHLQGVFICLTNGCQALPNINDTTSDQLCGIPSKASMCADDHLAYWRACRSVVISDDLRSITERNRVPG